MNTIDIIVMISVILVFGLIIGSYIYKRVKGIPFDDCGECHNKKKLNKMFTDIRKELDEERCHNECHCCK